MIKKIITCMVTCILTCTLAQAATVKEYTQVFKEATAVCKVYKHPCTIEAIKDDKMWAITMAQGKIQVSTKLLETMNQAQVRGVVYHETGHAVFQHVEKSAEYMYESMLNGTFDKDYYNEFRRQNELQADRFATYLGLFTLKDTDLIGALIILTPPDDFYKTHPSHPSTNDRIEQIEQILGR